MTTFKAAAVQATPAWLDLDATTDKTIDLIGEAARNGADLVAFAETWIPGYPYHAWLGSQAWAMQYVQAYAENSLAVDGPQAQRIRDAAARHGVHVVLGYSERAGGSLYMGQMLIDRDGATVAARRKLKPTHVERTVFGEGDGSDLAVHATDIGRVGMLCCWEHLQPLTKYAMYAQDEQVHVGAWPSFSLYPMATALGPEVNTAVSRVYAVEGGCFVLAPSMPVTQELIDRLCDTDDKRELLLTGGGATTIFGPDGSTIAAAAPDEETIVYADVDLGLIALAKAAADPAGHYARADVTRLLLDRRPRRPVEHAGPEAPPAQAELEEVVAG
jgi:aliphatic nitrilase